MLDSRTNSVICLVFHPTVSSKLLSFFELPILIYNFGKPAWRLMRVHPPIVSRIINRKRLYEEDLDKILRKTCM
ncbi:hypothetical protein V6N13_002983 [Hibiscus sabdariffa]